MSSLPLEPMDVDRMDAAQALLGVSPATVAGIHSMMYAKPKRDYAVPRQQPRSSSKPTTGLDALAALACTRMDATKTNAAPDHPTSSHSGKIIPSCGSSSSDEDDVEAMPPPPPRRRRNRSVSNPEGMEKWERQYFVLPTAIIEEELAEAKAATEAKEEEERRRREEAEAAAAAAAAAASCAPTSKTTTRKRTSPVSVASPMDEMSLPPEELLRRARSRLLEDLSEGSLQGEKGSLTLPHCLSKYKNVYNKNGRIGIYTPAERAAILSRFQEKRSRRVWNKKIRYSCRKNLADRRLRVKGRFVKRPPVAPTPPPAAPVLDVTDKEAGFQPTADMPYRRQRRHTIT